MEHFECNDDEDFREQFLILLTESPYPKLISSMKKDGTKLDINTVAWSMTIAEENNFVPVLVTIGALPTYFIGFCKNTRLTGYFAQKPLFC
jgi:hypothetical protein